MNADDPASNASGKRSPWAWLGVTILVLAFAAAALFLGRSLFSSGSGQKVTVPDVVGMTTAEAQRALESQGPQPRGADTADLRRTRDTVLAQDPGRHPVGHG